ncbi:PspC domain-containing protein [Kitasatospora aburaviensis]
MTRTEHHRVVAGVCGGLGRHLDIDPVVFRVVTVVLCLSGGLGLFLYGLAWLVVPTEPVPDGKGGSRAGRTELQRVLTGRVDGQSVGAVLLTVIGTGVFFSSMGDGDQFFPLLLLAALVFLAVRYDPERRRGGRVRGRRRGREHRHGPYDRLFPEAEPTAPAATWPRTAEDEEIRERHARERAAGTVPVDTPHAGPTGYLWDPRHPERNPYGDAGATPSPGARPSRGGSGPTCRRATRCARAARPLRPRHRRGSWCTGAGTSTRRSPSSGCCWRPVRPPRSGRPPPGAQRHRGERRRAGDGAAGDRADAAGRREVRPGPQAGRARAAADAGAHLRRPLADVDAERGRRAQLDGHLGRRAGGALRPRRR